MLFIDLRDLLLKMLTIDPKRRVTLSDIRHHPWILKDFKEPPQTFVPKFKTITHIDESIMTQVVELGFEDTPSARLAIVKNKAKQVVTAYQLCLNRKERDRASPRPSSSSQADSATSLQNQSILQEEVSDTNSQSHNEQQVCIYQKKNR
jgi:serine/threonine protein kinase